MSFWVGLIGFALVFSLVIVIHEACHFLMAKHYGMKVEEFFLGFGPRIWSFRRGETEYGVKWIFFGGYVKIAGMNPYVETPEEDLPRTFGAKPIWQRAVTIAAGPVSHFILAFVVAWLFLAFIGPTEFAASIQEVEPTLGDAESPAAASGLRAGDMVVAVNGVEVDGTGFVEATRAHVGEEITLTVRRDGQTLTLTTTPVLAAGPDGTQIGRLGVSLSETPLPREPLGVISATPAAAEQIATLTRESVVGFARAFGPEGIKRVGTLVFGDADRSLEDPVSVVGAARLSGQLSQQGQLDVLVMLFISFNVFIGLLNLIPLPPFDGGHLAALAIEKVRKKPVDMRKMIPVSAVVLTFFLLYTSAVVFLDLFKPVEF